MQEIVLVPYLWTKFVSVFAIPLTLLFCNVDVSTLVEEQTAFIVRSIARLWIKALELALKV